MSDVFLAKPEAEYAAAMRSETLRGEEQISQLVGKPGFASVLPTAAVGSQSTSFRQQFRESMDSIGDSSGDRVGRTTAKGIMNNEAALAEQRIDNQTGD